MGIHNDKFKFIKRKIFDVLDTNKYEYLGHGMFRKEQSTVIMKENTMFIKRKTLMGNSEKMYPLTNIAVVLGHVIHMGKKIQTLV